MRGLIRGGWVIGFGDRTHTLIRDGVVVWEDGRIVHVGPPSMNGDAMRCSPHSVSAMARNRGPR